MAKQGLRRALAALLVVVAFGLGGIVPASAWIENSASGQIGERKMVDTASFAGAVCYNDLTSLPGSVSIEARTVYLKPATGNPTQTMSVRYLLYQELPGGSLAFLSGSPLLKKQGVASGFEKFGPYSFQGRALGPRYVVVVEMIWYNAQGAQSGHVRARINSYEMRIEHSGGDTFIDIEQAFCISPWVPKASVTPTQGTVQSSIKYSLRYYPANTAIPVKWDGRTVGSVRTSATGEASGTLAVPAAPMGKHQLTWEIGSWRATASFTVVPRIKLIPQAVRRGQTVNVSLRGYAAREIVRIRWKKGSSWVELARVTTSNTGSANVYVKVPKWAPDGPASVRGDGAYGRAQTNAVTVSGGPLNGSTVKSPMPDPSPTKTAISSAIPTATVSSTQNATIEPAPTQVPETSTPLATAPPEASPVAVNP